MKDQIVIDRRFLCVIYSDPRQWGVSLHRWGFRLELGKLYIRVGTY